MAVSPVPLPLLNPANAPLAVLEVPTGIAQKRSGANSRVFACGVEKERSGAHTCVEVGIGVA